MIISKLRFLWITAAVICAVALSGLLFAVDAEESGSDSSFTVSFDLAYDGAPVSPAAIFVDQGANPPVLLGESKPLPLPNRKGYSFAGWYSSANAGQLYTEEILNAKSDGQDITLYAHWKVNSYTVYFKVNGGKALSQSSRVARYGEDFGSLPIPTRVGYTFKGWYSATSDKGEKYTKSKVTAKTAAPSENITLYAHWKANKYKVLFDVNGGKAISTKSKNVTFDSAYGQLPSPKKNRSKFLGWYTAEKGGTKVTAATLYKKADSRTLYARWRKQTKCKVIFDTRSGILKSSPVKYYTYDKAMGSLPTAYRPGFDFLGWYYAPIGGGRVTTATRVTTQNASSKIFAHWAPHQYFQFDSRWAWHRYQTTVRGSGCGPSTMSMVVNAIKANGVTPLSACNWSRSRGYIQSAPGKTKPIFFTKYPAYYGVKSTPLNNTDLRNMSPAAAAAVHKKAAEAVKDGKWVVCFMRPGNWTHVGHYILWYNTVSGRAMVRDPNATSPAKTQNYVSVLQSQVIRYYLIDVPDDKKIDAVRTGWYHYGGKTYYFNQDGIIHTGWLEYKNKRYYSNSAGIILTNGRYKIKGKYYKFNSNGVCIG